MPIVTSEYVRSQLTYFPETGDFVWNKTGKRAGCHSKHDGYVCIRLGPAPGTLVRAHRLAFAWMGEPLPKRIDHANGDRGDNRWANLRPCSQSQNVANSTRRARRYSQFKGVTWCKSRKRWQAKIMKDYRTIALGYFDDEQRAAAAYDVAAQTLFGEFARGNTCRS